MNSQKRSLLRKIADSSFEPLPKLTKVKVYNSPIHREYTSTSFLKILSYNIGNASYSIPGIFTKHIPEICGQETSFVAIQEHNFKAVPPSLKGYSCESSGRSALFCNNNIPYERLHDFENALLPLECVVLKIPTKASPPILLVSLYASPSLPPSSLHKLLHVSGNKRLVICGDFNAPGTTFGSSSPSPRGRMLDKICESERLHLINDPSTPTHLDRAGGTNNCLDGFLLSRDSCHKATAEVLQEWTISDHIPVLLDSTIEIPTKETTKRIVFSISKFEEAISTVSFGASVSDYISGVQTCIKMARSEQAGKTYSYHLGGPMTVPRLKEDHPARSPGLLRPKKTKIELANVTVL
jgi:hypothetical protein